VATLAALLLFFGVAGDLRRPVAEGADSCLVPGKRRQSAEQLMIVMTRLLLVGSTDLGQY
jgi:hypothetical protein